MSGRPDWLRFQRRARLSGWQSLGVRALLVAALFCIALGGHWLDRDGLRDNIDGSISFLDVVYFTTITVTTVGYGDIVPVTDAARMFDTFVVTPVRLFVYIIFLGTAYEFVFQRAWDRWLMDRIGRRLQGHMVVVGFGASGEAAVNELLRAGTEPGHVVVVDRDPERVACAVAEGVTGLEGDATRDAVLHAARVENAAGVLLCVGADDTTALVALSVQRMAPRTRIAALVRSPENEMLIRQAGADAVVNAVDLGGHLLARAGTSDVPEVVRELVTNDGDMCLCERAAGPDDIGRPLGARPDVLAVALRRGAGRIGFWERPVVAAGDVLIEIRPTAGR